jgi:FkbM family methyltransferase
MNNSEWMKMLMPTHEALHEKLIKDNSVIIYGAGYNGIATLIKLKEWGVPVLCLCDADRNKQGRTLSGVPVISLETLNEYARETIVLISPERHVAQIRKTLRDMGFRNLLYCTGTGVTLEAVIATREAFLANAAENLEESNTDKIAFVSARLCDEKSKEIFSAVLDANFRAAYEKLEEYQEDEQYFSEDIIGLRENEVFVDCGALNGDTVLQFIRRAPTYEYIYSFEPEPLQFELTKALFTQKRIEYCKIFNLAVSHSKQRLRFVSDGDSSTIDNSGNQFVSADSLDNILLNEAHRPTYIKMDIEGAELDALRGVEKLIDRDHPKLAISVYHKIEDVWEIPHYIMRRHPGYRIYLRQHAAFTETVCYGIWEGEGR